MRTMRFITNSFTYVACVATLARFSFAGDINPPAGPIGPTMKPLTDIEPRIAVNATNTPGDAASVYRIAAPGSYYLTANVVGVAGKHGVQIAASDVTLDLMGFEIVGVVGSLDGVNAPVATPLNSGISVRNGTVRAWGDDGIDLSLSVGGSCIGLIATGNTATGIHAPIGATVFDCTSRQNGAGGFIGGVVNRNCYASNNTGDGMLLGAGSIAENCVSSVNTGNGFNGVGHVNFLNCGAGGNTLVGFVIANSGVANGCIASQNTGSGFSLDQGAMAVNCSSTLNDGDGFTLGSSCSVRASSARINELDGIRGGIANVIVDNHCLGNGNAGDGAGVHTTGADNRIDGNTVTSNDRGIDVDGTNSLILRNVATGNTTNYDIVIGNRYGQVFDISAGAAQAVLGNFSAVNTVNTENPWANFTY